MAISTINQAGLNAPLTLTAPVINTVTSAASTALTLQSAGTTAVTIDTSQNVGIGTTSPAYKLDVVSTANSIGNNIAARNTTSGTAAGSQMIVGNDGTPDLIVIRALSTTYTSSGFNTADGSLIRASGAGGLSLAANNGSGIVNFFTGGNTERMRIDSSGNVLVNATSSTGHKMTVQSAAGAGGIDCVGGATNGYYAMRVDMPSTNTYGVLFRNNGNNVGDIRINSSTTTYNTSSDYRLKEDIVPMTGALNKVSALKPVTYKWKSTGEESQGFIAHELQAVVPDCVTGKKDAVDADGNPEYQGVDTSFLVATLVAAIQELKAEFDAYKASHP
jgi:hypothetical protein